MGNTNDKIENHLYEPIEDFEIEYEKKENFKKNKYDILYPDEDIRYKANEIFDEVLKMSDLKINDEIWAEDIKIDFYGKNYLHTIRTKNIIDIVPEDKDRDIIIFLHGFQATCANWIKMIKYFQKDFDVYCPDIIGMGISSRPQPNFDDNPKDFINFFVDSIEALRIEIYENIKKNKDKDKKFYLVGHSFGGYICANYALKYPQNIKRLFLLSPVGISKNINREIISKDKSIKEQLVLSFAGYIWNAKITMKEIFESFLFKGYLDEFLKKRHTLPEEENEALKNWTKIVLSYPKDLDHSIYCILKCPLPSAKFPLEDLLFEKVKSFKIDFIFGTEDWMDTNGSLNLCEKNDYKRFRLFWILKATHSFLLDKADETAKLILNRIKLDS
jgi:pimeloyl-ACP methyl ester carboxylesterase